MMGGMLFFRTQRAAPLQGICFVILMLLAACGVNPAERNNAGNQYTTNAEYEQAINAYQAAQVADPEEALFYFNSAEALMAAGQGAEAVAALEQAILRGDDTIQADAYYNLGNLYLENAQFDEAIDVYQDVLLLRPDDTDARHNLELAILYRGLPSPTPIELKIEPEDQQTDPDAIPTPNPAGIAPTPTPTPPFVVPPGPSPEFGGDDGEESDEDVDSTPRPERNGTMTVEEAQRMLDPVIREQDGVGGMPELIITPGTPASGRDW